MSLQLYSFCGYILLNKLEHRLVVRCCAVFHLWSGSFSFLYLYTTPQLLHGNHASSCSQPYAVSITVTCYLSLISLLPLPLQSSSSPLLCWPSSSAKPIHSDVLNCLCEIVFQLANTVADSHIISPSTCSTRLSSVSYLFRCICQQHITEHRSLFNKCFPPT